MEHPSLAFTLSRLAHTPHGPTPIGVFRDIERPSYDELLAGQIAKAKEKGEGELAQLIGSGDTWTLS
jgi:2-oxoglutarate ferredoxin oxidoreductase subunit beta